VEAIQTHNRRDPRENRVLDALPGQELERLLPQLALVAMPAGMTIHEAGDELRHVYFPLDSTVALLHVLQDGATVEIAMVGSEGAIGLPLFMGGATTSNRALVQSGGSAYRLTRQRLKAEFNCHGRLLTLLMQYTLSLVNQTAQTAICNRHHTLDQQLCRWLLLSLDRLSANTLALTQEFIAGMLGVRREAVTGAARKLQDLGVICCQRGRITVLDRPQLETLSCECYAVVRAETDGLFADRTPFLGAPQPYPRGQLGAYRRETAPVHRPAGR
jgi:CRP-like cAMP-binding protein